MVLRNLKNYDMDSSITYLCSLGPTSPFAKDTRASAEESVVSSNDCRQSSPGRFPGGLWPKEYQRYNQNLLKGSLQIVFQKSGAFSKLTIPPSNMSILTSKAPQSRHLTTRPQKSWSRLTQRPPMPHGPYELLMHSNYGPAGLRNSYLLSPMSLA